MNPLYEVLLLFQNEMHSNKSNIRRLLVPMVLAALVAGCSTSELFKDYPGALNNGRAIFIDVYQLESDSAHFCVQKISIEIDGMPAHAPTLTGKKPRCTVPSKLPNIYRNGGGFSSAYPLLDYKKIIVRVTRTPGGEEETYILRLNGKLLTPPPPSGAEIEQLSIVTTDVGVRAYRRDFGQGYSKKTLIAESKEKL